MGTLTHFKYSYIYYTLSRAKNQVFCKKWRKSKVKRKIIVFILQNIWQAFVYYVEIVPPSCRTLYKEIDLWYNEIRKTYPIYFIVKEGSTMQLVQTDKQNANKNIPLLFYRGSSKEKVL